MAGIPESLKGKIMVTRIRAALVAALLSLLEPANRLLWRHLGRSGLVLMATSDYLSGADLAAVARGGVINESLMQKIWEIDNIPLPFTDAVGSDTHENELTTWVQDSLASPNIANAAVDGQDVATWNNQPPGPRVGNHSQISTKAVSVSQRAQNSSAVGGQALARQVSQRQLELRRDVEAIALYNQASLADDGNTVAGKAGGLASWYATNVSLGATGAAGGYSTATGLTVAATPGTKRAGSEVKLRDLLQSVWTNGGNPTQLMSVPSVIRGLSDYMFTATARVATLMSDAGQSKTAMVAKGSVNVFVSDFGVTVELVGNRLQQVESAGQATLHIIDPGLIELSYLQGYNVQPLAKTGLADKREMSVDWTLKVLNEKGLGGYFAIDTAIPWVA